MLKYIAPGAVFNLMVEPILFTVVLTWSVPQEPNGVIISYQVTYRVDGSDTVTVNVTSTTFTIRELVPGTNVTQISVSAYTSVGQGPSTQHEDVMTLDSPRELT